MSKAEWLQLLSSGFSSGFDLAALVAFFTIAVIYLLLPVLGYRKQRSASMVCALALLIFYGGLFLCQLALQWKTVSEVWGRDNSLSVDVIHHYFFFAILKLGALLAAMIAFCVGVCTVPLRLPGNPAENSDPADQPRG